MRLSFSCSVGLLALKHINRVMRLTMFLTLMLGVVIVKSFKHKVTLPASVKGEPPSEAFTQALLEVLKSKVLKLQTADIERMLPDSWNNLNSLVKKVNDTKEVDSELALSTWFYSAVDAAAGREENGFDPFRAAKFAEISSDPTSAYITDLSAKLLDFSDEELVSQTLKNVVELSLWGTLTYPLEITPTQRLNAAQVNAAAFGSDPDMAAALEKTRKKTSPRQRRQSFANVLGERRQLIQNEAHAKEVDVLTKVASFLSEIRAKGDDSKGSMHIVTEKVGHGLISDLLLGHVLLSLGIASKVHYHSKPYSCGSPLSVTPTDITGHIEHLADPTKGGDIWNVRHFGEALRQHVMSGEFVLEEPDLFWTDLAAPLYEMPASLQACFTEATCTFVKGDAMYRRMLGDVDWKTAGYTTPEALSYWPGPLCVLRTVGDRGAIEALLEG